jgi:LysM repeat protein
LATGGASLPVIAGLTYALDAAIKGEKLSSVLGKGAGAAALAWAGQSIAGMFGADPAAGAAAAGTDPASAASGFVPGADLPTYTAQAGDNLSKIAARFDVSVGELRGLNPQLADATGATGGQSMNPDVIFPGQEITLPPASGSGTYDGGVGTSAGTQADIASGQVPDSAISRRLAQVRESVQHKILTFEQLIDQKRTEMSWTLNESIGRKNNSFVLTTAGTYAVFENVERYRRAMMEVAGVPGSTRPEFYRPDMSGGATEPAPATKKPGLLSRGLSRVGGALSTFGRQFTTNVTKEKLKMNWHQARKPSDSDQLAAWLVTQGVPQDVVSSIYKKMGLPVAAAKPAANTAPAKKAATPKSTSPGVAAAPAGGAGAFGAMTKSLQQPEKSSTGGTTAQTATGLKHTASAQNPNATPAQPTAAAAGTKPGAQPASYNAANVMKLPGMEKYAKASPAVAPRAANFAGPSGYGQTTMGFKAPGTPKAPAAAPAVPKTSRATAQGGAPTKTPTQAEKDAYVRSIGAPALPEADQEKVGNMDADRFDAAMARLKQLAGAGPLKTVYDPAKRVYRNVPTAVQPQTQPKKS